LSQRLLPWSLYHVIAWKPASKNTLEIIVNIDLSKKICKVGVCYRYEDLKLFYLKATIKVGQRRLEQFEL
jgi:hypothetical protein